MNKRLALLLLAMTAMTSGCWWWGPDGPHGRGDDRREERHEDRHEEHRDYH
jgi:hypothetical protein